MQKSVSIIIFFISLHFYILAHNRAEKTKNCLSCKVKFTENKNQWDSRILYLYEMNNGRMLLEKNGFTFDFYDADKFNDLVQKLKFNKKTRNIFEDKVIKGHVYRVNFLNSLPHPSISASYPEAGYLNYFLGKDKSYWASKVKEYGKVVYQNLYPKINMKVYGNEGELKYDFIILPGGNPNQIRLEYQGVDNVFLQNENLFIKTSVNEIIEQKPIAYQIKGKEKVNVPCKFVLQPSSILSFDFPDGYDTTKELIIDPTLIFSTYSGSTADNWGFTATYDKEGNAYGGGIVFRYRAYTNINSGFGYYPATNGAYQFNFMGGYCDVGIMKLKPDGTQLIYATYLGGEDADVPHSLVVNNNNELVILGTTSSLTFPVTGNAYDTTFNGGSGSTPNYTNGSDIFVAKLSTDGTQLLASTYVGGSNNDGLNTSYDEFSNDSLFYNYGDMSRGDITIDKNNNCYIATCSESVDFPVTSNAFQNSFGGGIRDGCVFKLDNSLSTLMWSSFLGGNNNDASYSIAEDKTGDIFVSGGTSSGNFPVSTNALHPTYLGGTTDGFITHISGNGEKIIHSTFYGSPQYDQCYFVQLDNEQSVYIYGQTNATGSTLIYNAGFSEPNSGQFISKLNNTLDTLIFSTVFGTGNNVPDISPTAFLVDVCDKIYVSGWGGSLMGHNTSTFGLPTTSDAIQSNTDGEDFYFMVIDKNASALVYATYFGGSSIGEHVDGGTSRFDKNGIIYQSVCGACGGQLDSTITTPGAWTRLNQSLNCNNMVLKLNFDLPILIADFDIPIAGCLSDTFKFINKSTNSSSYFWTFGDDSTSSMENPIHVFSQPGVYGVKLKVQNSLTCNTNDSITRQIRILGNSKNILSPDTICSGGNIQIGFPSGIDTVIKYLWTPSTGLNDSSISNPIAGPAVSTDYMLVIYSGNCSDTLKKPLVVVSAKAVNDTTICKGDTILIGNNFSIGKFSWYPNYHLEDTALANPSAFPDTTTVYTLTVSNLQCIRKDTIKIEVIKDSSFILSPKEICKGDQIQIGMGFDSIIDVFYLWQPSTGLDDSLILNPWASPDSNIIYNLFISSLNRNCTDTIRQSVKVLYANAGMDTAICKGDSILIGMNNQGVNYLWSPGKGLSDPALSNPIAFPDSATEYIVTISNGNCSRKDTINISINDLQTTKAIADTTLCLNDTIQLRNGEIINSYGYSWSPGSTLNDSAVANPFAFPIVTTQYFFTVKDSLTRCMVFDTVLIILDTNKNVFADFTTELQLTCEKIIAKFNIINSNATYYHWNFGDGTFSNEVAPAHAFLFNKKNTVTLSCFNNNRCSDSGSVISHPLLNYDEYFKVKIPNVFTPNHDQYNDCFKLGEIGLPDGCFEIKIFNRWGEIVFESADVNECWNGKVKRSGKDADEGVYFYLVKIKELDFAGFVTIIR